MSETVTLLIDPEVCVGIGQCESFEPEVFVYDEDAGFASARAGATLPPDRADQVIRACPSGAIRIVDGGGDG